MPVAHTLKLYGGTTGARKGNSQVALSHYRQVLETRVKCIMAVAASDQYRFQVPGTSVKKPHAPRWSGAFRANWRIKASVASRYPWDGDLGGDHAGEFTKFIKVNLPDEVLTADAIMQMGVNDNIFVYNVSPYAKWINQGGYDPDTFLGQFLPPARFLEVGIEEAKGRVYEYVEKGLAMAAAMKRSK